MARRAGVPQVVTVPCQMMRMLMPVPSWGVPILVVWGSNVTPPEPRLNSGQGVSSRQVRALYRQVPGCVLKNPHLADGRFFRKISTGFSLAEGLFETWGRINIKCASISFWEVERARFLMISPSLSLSVFLSFFFFLPFLSLSLCLSPIYLMEYISCTALQCV